ncbi:aminopeptidase, partial [bacterium]|nr:aminopeptidase [bacterium]
NPVFRELIENGKRIIYLGHPTPEKAEIMGLDYRALHDAWWTALDVDYGRLSAHCEELADRIGSSSEVRVTSSGGTDITFGITGREVFVDDGIISKWETEHQRGWGHLPAGKVIVAPVAGTANGVIHSEMTDYFGVPIRNIRLQFRDGAVVSATAGENEELLELVLVEGGDESRLAGGFELGTNPQITNPVGYAVWDSKSYGDATVWIGDNRLIGGENEAPLSWGFIIASPTVFVDGVKVVEKRVFIDM